MKKKAAGIISLVIFILLLVVWQLLSHSQSFHFLFGSPLAIWQSLWTNLLHGTLLYDTFLTGVEGISGFVIGIVLGTIAGFLLWYSEFLAAVSKPYITVLGAIPVFAFAPMIIIWFGVGIPMKIALAAFSVFLISLTQSYQGAKNVNKEEYKLLKLYGASRFQILQKVIIPSSLSWVFASMRLNIGFAILGAFIGEFISSDAGVGHFMLTAGSLYDIPSVFAGGVMLVLLSLLLTWVVTLVEKKRLKIISIIS